MMLTKEPTQREKRYICINDLKTEDYGKVFKSS